MLTIRMKLPKRLKKHVTVFQESASRLVINPCSWLGSMIMFTFSENWYKTWFGYVYAPIIYINATLLKAPVISVHRLQKALRSWKACAATLPVMLFLNLLWMRPAVAVRSHSRPTIY